MPPPAMGPNPIVLGVLAIALVILVALWWLYQHHQQRRHGERWEALQDEFDRFHDDLLKTNSLPPVQTTVILAPDEVAIRQESVQLHEPRAVRLSNYIGTRFGRIHLGSAVSRSYQTMTPIDRGVLLLTSERLVFDGGKENRILPARQILSVQPAVDAIEVSSSRRQKSQVYTVRNPVIWAVLIQSVASGKADAFRELIANGAARQAGTLQPSQSVQLLPSGLRTFPAPKFTSWPRRSGRGRPQP